jgi:hypothetical protein
MLSSNFGSQVDTCVATLRQQYNLPDTATLEEIERVALSHLATNQSVADAFLEEISKIDSPEERLKFLISEIIVSRTGFSVTQ